MLTHADVSSGDGSGADNMQIEGGRGSFMGNAADDDDEGDEQGNGGSMSEDEEMEEEGDTLGAHHLLPSTNVQILTPVELQILTTEELSGTPGEEASVRAAPPALPAGKGKGVLRKQLSPRKAAAAEGVPANTPNHTVFAQHFKQAWCAMTRKTETEYHKELLKMKGPGEDDVTFEIHEMYWSVQSFGGSRCQYLSMCIRVGGWAGGCVYRCINIYVYIRM
jgi:hypothetical protein